MDAIHSGHRNRLKEEFMRRPESFPDHKVLELLLFYSIPRRDTNPIAHELINAYGSLSGVVDARPEDLCRQGYVGESTAVLLRAVKELSRRYLLACADCDNMVTGVQEAIDLLQPYFFGVRNERVCVACLDPKGKCLGVRQVSDGSADVAGLDTRKIVEAALSLNASSVILAHNHPSGSMDASEEDREASLHLLRVLAKVGIELIDHLIFTDRGVASMRELGLFGSE